MNRVLLSMLLLLPATAWSSEVSDELLKQLDCYALSESSSKKSLYKSQARRVARDLAIDKEHLKALISNAEENMAGMSRADRQSVYSYRCEAR
ncbi:hypothetical protein [Motilimonas pumila]|uniref:Uncharacterized protein n=1 Tax=Motilimonas pumila TaxID=2303987 RepID=A0A418YGA8_9GAMM|nr:hypothetical protein [Motilimonas pumila]RJG48702.1 hypothetical protein D1Z90_07535 [Motilimonas pumila]